jgi:gamma-glutamyltranspeptidase/glutathione hydrolase
MSGMPDATRYGGRGAVASVDHHATSAGLALLRQGGSAADAAVGASAVLAVTTQHMCGAGGDLLAVVGRPDGRVESLLAVGRAGSGSDAEAMRQEGLERMPFRDDVRTVTVPGCVDGWVSLHERHGRLPLADVLAPAVELAERGFAASPLLSAAAPSVAGVPGLEFCAGVRPGEVRRRPALATALAAIGREGRSAWYQGDFGRELLELGAGLFTEDDLRQPLDEWGEPLSLRVGDSVLHSVPPPAQGYLVLSSAWIAEAVSGWGDVHLLVEASRAAGHDRLRRLGDGVTGLLDDLEERAALVDPDRARTYAPPVGAGGTIYLCSADEDGLVVSLSQSNASGFGSGLAVPGVGVALHNRGIGFSLTPGSPAELRPGARPSHTLCPSLLVTDEAVTAVGTMGGDAQPQVVLQLLAALRGGATPAAALARPRWALSGPRQDGFDHWEPWADGTVAPAVVLEEGAPPEWEERLLRAGHRVERVDRVLGHAHCVVRSRDGRVAAAADPRAAGSDALAW